MINLRKRIEGVGSDESGFTTAELLGNAALGIIALAGIYALLTILGGDVLTMIRGKMLDGAG